MPDHRTPLFEQRPAELEVILPEPEHSFRWYEHDYPYPMARWNHHPEFEIHLIPVSYTHLTLPTIYSV